MNDNEPSFKLSYPLVFLSRAAGLSVLACLLGLWILRWFFSRDLGGEYAPAFYLLKHLIAFLIPALIFCALVVLLVASVALFAAALFASHKVAGPLFRLQRVGGYLNRQILVGRIHLRTGDQGKPVATCINEWVALRKERLSRLRTAAEQVELALRACEGAASRRDPRAIGEAVGQLQREARRIAGNRSKF